MAGTGAEARTVCTRVRANLHHPINRAKWPFATIQPKKRELNLPLFWIWVILGN